MNNQESDSPVKKRVNYSKGSHSAAMKLALEAAQSQINPNISEIALAYGVSRKSLNDRHKGVIPLDATAGKKPYLTKEEEDIIKNFLIDVAGLGFGYNKESLKNLIRQLLNKPANTLTDGWVQYFFSKHPDITTRRAEALDRLRAREIKKENINYYFDLLRIAYEKIRLLSNGNEITPQRIFSMDETAISMNKHSKYVISQKGVKDAFFITSENRQHVTLVGHASASGFAGHPFFILPRKTKDFPGQFLKDSKVTITQSAYMNDLIFDEWAAFFIKDIKEVRGDPRNWCLLILDGHVTHTLNPKALSLLNSANILALSLPSHCSSILQVHDVAIFGPLKKYFNHAMTDYIRINGPKVGLESLTKILETPWHAANNPFNIMAGFKKTGIYPLNLQWLEHNGEALKFIAIKEKEARFDYLCEKVQNLKFEDLFQRLKPLDLAVTNRLKDVQADKCPTLKKSLSEILLTTKGHHINDKKVIKRQNMILEDPSLPKLLNEPERLEKLKEKKKELEMKKNQKIGKRNHNTFSSQPIEFEMEDSQTMEEEISMDRGEKRVKKTLKEKR